MFENAKEVLDRRFVFLLLVLGLFSVGAYNFSFILLKAGSLGVQESYIPLVYACLNAATVALGIPAGILADRVGKVSVLCLSYLVFLATSVAGFVLTGSPFHAFLLAFLFGSYLAISETVQRAMIPDFTKPELKGTAYALYYTLIGVCSLAASLIFGALWTNVGSTVAFQYSTATSAIGIVALIAFILTKNTPKP